MFGETSLLWIWLVKFAPKSAPIIGLTSFVCILIDNVTQDPIGSPWIEVWRIGLTLAVGIFVTLCGVIYRDMNRRIDNLYKTHKEQYEENKNTLAANQRLLNEIKNRQDRVIGVMLTLATHVGSDKEAMIEAVKMIMSR
jgi:hypothetical protein